MPEVNVAVGQSGTPTNGATTPPIWAETPPAAAPETPPAPEPPSVEPVASRDWEAELAGKDVELKQLEQKLQGVEGASKESQAERQRLMVEVARLINEREAVEHAKEAALTQKTQELEQVSQATQTLAQKTQTLEQQLSEAQAKAVKLEVISQEFPHLIKYQGFIRPSASADEVRDACRQLEAAREADLGEYRQLVAGGVAARTVPTGTPSTRPEVMGDPEQLEKHLSNAMRNPALFEEEIKAAIQNYEARRR